MPWPPIERCAMPRKKLKSVMTNETAKINRKIVGVSTSALLVLLARVGRKQSPARCVNNVRGDHRHGQSGRVSRRGAIEYSIDLAFRRWIHYNVRTYFSGPLDYGARLADARSEADPGLEAKLERKS